MSFEIDIVQPSFWSTSFSCSTVVPRRKLRTLYWQGTWATETTRGFAFEELKLHRLELDVYSFNPRAERAYLKAGFKREGVLKDAVMDDNKYADDILMAILENEWRQIKGSYV